MRRSPSTDTTANDVGVLPDERLVDALRSLVDQLDATHDALGSLVASVAAEPVAADAEPVGDAPAPERSPEADVPDDLVPHLRSVETLLAS